MKLQDKSVLLVEDEPIIGFALEDMIDEQGARSVLVSSVEAGTDAIAKERFDLAIVDVNLNGEYSYPLADMLLETRCPFIFATGYGSVTHPDRFADTPTVGKPYDLDAILEAIDRLYA